MSDPPECSAAHQPNQVAVVAHKWLQLHGFALSGVGDEGEGEAERRANGPLINWFESLPCSVPFRRVPFHSVPSRSRSVLFRSVLFRSGFFSGVTLILPASRDRSPKLKLLGRKIPGIAKHI